jgi:catechol 2,3-dioxygenase-like lactoylglutathione lyase family enzyme
MIKDVANIWTPVQDIERANDFYENVLGLPVVKRDGLWAEVTPTRWRSASTAATSLTRRWTGPDLPTGGRPREGNR